MKTTSLLLSALLCASASAQTLNFQSGTYTFGANDSFTYQEAGFTVTSASRFPWRPGLWSCGWAPGGCEFHVARDDGAAFSLVSFDAYTTVFDYCFGPTPYGAPSLSVGGFGTKVSSCDYAATIALSTTTTSLSVIAGGLDYIHLTQMVLAAPVPEPQNWALLLLGLGALAMRRRAA